VVPKYRQREAVKSISFSLEPGEVLAFIGPNGAGKSTTIKMLTGILYPSAGKAHVLGMIPWQQRRKLAFHIARIYGQGERHEQQDVGAQLISPVSTVAEDDVPAFDDGQEDVEAQFLTPTSTMLKNVPGSAMPFADGK
jgi:ABC-type branched-subunit amino acid transport system ATPase component